MDNFQKSKKIRWIPNVQYTKVYNFTHAMLGILTLKIMTFFSKPFRKLKTVLANLIAIYSNKCNHAYPARKIITVLKVGER